jgi:hypothetical protein
MDYLLFLQDWEFWGFVLIGFVAQIVDGALGMAYGTLSGAMLLSLGVPPMQASASTHTAQFFTTAVSGFSHLMFKNIDRHVIMILAVAGGIGGVAGVLVLQILHADWVKPIISVYLFLLGARIMWRVFYSTQPVVDERRVLPRGNRLYSGLGLIGGFFDAIGGGGWGPIVTTTLISRSGNPRLVIGTVNGAEFFVKTVIAVTFMVTAITEFHTMVVGLLIGGVVAAPLGAYVIRWINPRHLMGMVAALIMSLSLWLIYKQLM